MSPPSPPPPASSSTTAPSSRKRKKPSTARDSIVPKRRLRKVGLDDLISVLYTINLKCSRKRYFNLRNHIALLPFEAKYGRPRRPDIICVQDPPPHIKYHEFPGYRIECYTRKDLSYEDQVHLAEFEIKPNTRKARRKHAKEEKEKAKSAPITHVNKQAAQSKEDEDRQRYMALIQKMGMDRVAFMIRNDIPKVHWSVTRPTRNVGLVSTLHLETTSGIFNIHNFYNHLTSIDLDALRADCMNSASDILMGDSNLHHELWGGPDVKTTCPKGIKLASAIRHANMHSCLKKGTVTYSRGLLTSRREYCTTIDLVLTSGAIASRAYRCDTIRVRGFESDHRIIRLELDIEPTRVKTIRYRWKDVKTEEFLARTQEEFESLDMPATVDLQAYGKEIVDRFTAIRKACVPEASSLRKIKRPSKALLIDQKLERQALNEYMETRSERSRMYWERHREAVERLMKAENRDSFRRRVATTTAKHRYASFMWARRAQRWSEPKQSAQFPVLKVGDAEFKTTAQQADCFANTVWPESVCKKEDGTKGATTQLPTLSPERRQLLSSQVVTKEEVLKILGSLPSKKATGHDGVENEMLKLSRHITAPYITHFFQAGMEQTCHSLGFKHAFTFVIRKADKEDYSTPKSYRPIAVLSNLGKAFERLIGNRLTDLAIQHDLLPRVQFGAPGRSTTKALQYLLNPVYSAWGRGRGKRGHESSLMSLDISGAFDRVNREKLLEVLAAKGIPDWLIRLVASFLSDRSTELDFFGARSDPYWVNIGIPQGSPLSPILFLFFASPIFESFETSEMLSEAKPLYRATINALAYVDDTYLLVTSPSHARNNIILELLHDELLAWAQPNGVTFGPPKYHILHFRRPKHPKYTKLPNIPGLAENAGKVLVRDSLSILGVLVDPSLNWKAHVAHIRGKVERKMDTLRRMSGSIWGPSLYHMRNLYLTTVRPRITYACGAWFMNSEDTTIPWNSNKTLIMELEKIQYQCLIQISGALEGTSREVLLKELHIDRIAITLQRMALAHRTIALHDQDTEAARRIRQTGTMRSLLDQHPYEILRRAELECEQGARDLMYQRHGQERGAQRWAIRKHRTKVIKDFCEREAFQRSKEHWNWYRRNHFSQNKTHAPALRDGFLAEWNDHSLKLHKNLLRPQSTILLQMRTGAIGLNSYLAGINLSSTNDCPCGLGKHTVVHLFMECRRLSKSRGMLYKKLRHLHMHELLTKHVDIATEWAICHFDIAQFDKIKKGFQFHRPKQHPHGSREDGT